MWIDTHTHFSSSVFDKTRDKDWSKAQSKLVVAQIMMSLCPSDFSKLKILSNNYNNSYFALGIHPMFTSELNLNDSIHKLKNAIKENINNPYFIGIGEIGLDGFIKNLDWQIQINFFIEQLKIAKEFSLPVFLHTRKEQDRVLKYCRQFAIKNGIAHAFNGSNQQAYSYIKQGFKLGFGGAFTFDRATKLQQLLKTLPLSSFVLETDCPNMSPAWAYRKNNYSYYLSDIAKEFAKKRQIEIEILSKQIIKNTIEVVPIMNKYLK